MRTWAAWLVAAALTATAGLVSAADREDDDDGKCGVNLVFRNPDLQADEDGIIHAAGWFFIQFQAVGEGAENVAYITFSFGKADPSDQGSCTGPAWYSGTYVQNYRGDYDPTDGFFVPINTTVVPDDLYGAAIHAFNDQDQEIGRFWALAQVDNCDGGQGTRCGDDAEQVRKHDNVVPWPIVLPGDGQQVNDVAGLTVEFAEGIKSVEAWINGEPIVLQSWEGVARDDDTTPGNDDPNGPTYVSCAQAGPQCNKRVWGPSFQWEGEILENDILKVRAVDRNDNVAVKIIHLLDPNAGGILAGNVVDVNIQVDRDTIQTLPGQPQMFNFTLINLANTDAHVGLRAEAPALASTRWFPDHVVIPSGGRSYAEMEVTPDGSVRDGDFHVRAFADYQSEGKAISKEALVTLVVGKGGELQTEPADNQTDNSTIPEDAESPALAFSAVLVASAVAMLRRRR